MKKGLVVAAVIAAVGFLAWFALPRILGSQLELPEGVPYSVGGVSLNPFSGTARLSMVELHTQAPYRAPYVVRVDEVTARFDPKSAMSDFIVVKEVIVSGADVRIELQGRNVNLREALRHLEAYLAEADTTSLPRVFVQEFRVVNAGGVVHSDAGEQPFRMRDVVLRDLGSPDAGTPVQLLAGNLVEPVLLRALEDAGAAGIRERLGGLLGR